MRRRLLPEFTYRQGWWLTGAGMLALVAARTASGLLAVTVFLGGMALLSIALATFVRVDTEQRAESDD